MMSSNVLKGTVVSQSSHQQTAILSKRGTIKTKVAPLSMWSCLYVSLNKSCMFLSCRCYD